MRKENREMSYHVRRRDLLRASGVLAGAAAFGGLRVSRARAATELRMAWWGSDQRHQRTIQALELFSQQNPDITVSSEVGTFDSHFDKLAVQTAGGNAPDVFQMSGQLINEYAARGALLDLNQFIPSGIDTSTWDTSVTSHGLINGAMAGLPIGLDAYTICYDTTTLAEHNLEMPGADVTWEDFASFATQVAQTVGDGYFGVADAGGRYEPLETFVRQRGKTLFSADGTGIGFERQDLVEYWTYWNDLRESGAATSAEVQAAATTEELGPLVQGTAAMYFTTSSQFVNLQGLTEKELGLHTLPVGPAGETGSFIRPGLFISAYAETEHPQESALLINFLLNNPDAAAILLTARGVPPAPAIREQIQSLVTPEEQKTFGFIDQITTASTQSNILTPAGGLEVTDLLARSYQAIAFGQSSIDEAADDFFEQAPSLLGS
jgi:multiple sugar transport system substrate-binding protein